MNKNYIEPENIFTHLKGGRGNGKSHFYLRVIQEALERGDDVLILRKKDIDSKKKK